MEIIKRSLVITILSLMCYACASTTRDEKPLEQITLPDTETTITYHEGALRRVAILPPAIKKVRGNEVLFMDEYGERLQKYICQYLSDWKSYECMMVGADDAIFSEWNLTGSDIYNFLSNAVDEEPDDLSNLVQFVGRSLSVDGVILLNGTDRRLTKTQTYLFILSATLVPTAYLDAASIDAYFLDSQSGNIVWHASYWTQGHLTRESQSFWGITKLTRLIESLFDDIENAAPEGLINH